MTYGVEITIVFAMNRGIDYWVSIPCVTFRCYIHKGKASEERLIMYYCFDVSKCQ